MSSTGGGFGYSTTYPNRHAWYTRWDMPMPHHGLRFSSGPDDGFSASKDLPILMVSSGPDWKAPGFFFGMEWSGMWEATLSCPLGGRNEDGSWQGHIEYLPAQHNLLVEIGPIVSELTLEPGESLVLPKVHIGFFDEGFESGTSACRRYIAQRIAPPTQADIAIPPVTWISWPGIRSAFTEEDMYRQADAASDLGIEIFVPNDWYQTHHTSGFGNWEEDRDKWPRGIEAFSAHVRSRGMGFGLYLDIECAAPGTMLMQQHAELFYSGEVGKYMPPGSRLLNYGLPETREYSYEMLCRLIDRYQVSYLFWDLNAAPAPVWRIADPTGKVQFAHYEGLYELWEKLRERFPNLIVQRSAAGAHRVDLGTLSQAHCGRCYEADTHPHISHRMQLAANLFIPGAYMGSFVGPWPLKEHVGLDEGLPDLSFISRMAGQFSLHGRIADLASDQAARARHWIGVYKEKIRPLLAEDYYRLLPQPQSEADWDAGQFCEGTEQGVIFVFRYEGVTDRQNLRLRSLQPDAAYTLRDEKSGAEETYSGHDLLEPGLPVSLLPNSAKVYSYAKHRSG